MSQRTEASKAQHAAYNRAWRASNEATVRAYNTAYREAHLVEVRANREVTKAYNRAYRLANLVAARAREATRRALERGTGRGATTAQLAARWDYYGGLCWMCSAVATCTDHVKPLSKGGTNLPANLRPACRPCNSRKQAKWPFAVAA